MDRSTELATLWGIEASYLDVEGRRRDADAETLRRIAEALSAGGNEPVSGRENSAATELTGARLPGRRRDNAGCSRCSSTGMRSRRNWGTAISAISRILCKSSPISAAPGIGLNPLHVQFYDRPDNSGSPYSPNSRLFLNPLYIDVDSHRGIRSPRCGRILPKRYFACSNAELINYRGDCEALKIAALRADYRNFRTGGGSKRAAMISRPIGRNGVGTLECFAAFETLRQLQSGAWREWPEPWRKPGRCGVAQHLAKAVRTIGFHEFLQWNAERQLERCRDVARRRGLAIGLYLDTAIGVDSRWRRAWMDQSVVLRGLSAGAPPDQFNTAGQDWGTHRV